jgi:hypothetical protein
MIYYRSSTYLTTHFFNSYKHFQVECVRIQPDSQIFKDLEHY